MVSFQFHLNWDGGGDFGLIGSWLHTFCISIGPDSTDVTLVMLFSYGAGTFRGELGKVLCVKCVGMRSEEAS